MNVPISRLGFQALLRFLKFVFPLFKSESKSLNPETSYFQFPSNCQIPHLSFIYDFYFGKSQKTLVEIGAYDGFNFSNSSGLIERGWNAELYEPIPEYFRELHRRYKDYPDVKTHMKAVGAKSGLITLYKSGALTSADINTTLEYRSIDWAKKHLTGQLIEADCITLAEVFSRARKFVDLLIVDVEGSEPDVFQSFGTIKNKPSMLIVEIPDLHPDLKVSRMKSHKLLNDLCLLNYQIVYKDSINTVFVQSEIVSAKYR